MALGDINITVVGNLTNDPELRFTPSGAAVASFTVASSSRYLDKQTNEWKDSDSTFLRCSVWRQYAENVAESLTKGSRVIVTGRLKQRSYETKEGEKRTVFEIDVDDVGPALRYATAKVNRVQRGGGRLQPRIGRLDREPDRPHQKWESHHRRGDRRRRHADQLYLQCGAQRKGAGSAARLGRGGRALVCAPRHELDPEADGRRAVPRPA